MSAAAIADALTRSARAWSNTIGTITVVVREDFKKSLAIVVKEKSCLKVYTGNDARKILREESK